MLKHLAVLLLLTFSADAQKAPDYTGDWPNGRFWQEMTSASRLYFIMGFHEAVGDAVYAGIEEGVKIDFKRADKEVNFFFPHLSFGEVVKGVDRFYDDPENAPIPIFNAFRLFTYKAKGGTPREYESSLAEARQQAARFAQQDQDKSNEKK